MERAELERRLRAAAIAARDFGRRFIEEPLPDAMLFRLRLNSSYDGNPLVGDEIVFPDDGSFDRAAQVRLCTEQQALDELWREGRVPEWIDVAVIGETGSATLLELACCGRFTANEDRLYHEGEGRPPFHVTGPILPVGYKDGEKFSIYHRTECWTLADVDHLRARADNVWSLVLIGPVFDDDAMMALPDLPRMELLECRGTSIDESACRTRFAKLRVVRIK